MATCVTISYLKYTEIKKKVKYDRLCQAVDVGQLTWILYVGLFVLPAKRDRERERENRTHTAKICETKRKKLLGRQSHDARQKNQPLQIMF